MKPREFDELIKQKFDQNDFEYNPENWARLEERMRPEKKRSVIMWWMLPMMGIAASVVLAIGVSTMWREAATGNAGLGQFAESFHFDQNNPMTDAQGSLNFESDHVSKNNKRKSDRIAKVQKSKSTKANDVNFGIQLQNALSRQNSTSVAKVDEHLNKKIKKTEVVKEAVATFREEETKTEQKLSIMLLGGVSQGNFNKGYVAGATVRRMITSKVYIESDVAFASSDNTHNSVKETMVQDQVFNTTSSPVAKISKVTGNAVEPQIRTHIERTAVTENYNTSYVQVSPAIGVKIMKKLSIAAGPDFQQVLADNRPVHNSDYTRENISVLPTFDVGMVGKTEYAVTKNLKAQVSYRKGINNVLTPMDKYIDRNYLQVQIRYSILNK